MRGSKLFLGERLAPSLLFSAAVFLPVFFFSSDIPSQAGAFFVLSWTLFVSVLAFMIFYSGEVYFYRQIFFVAVAVAFFVHFKSYLFGAVAAADCRLQSPYCHIAMASSFGNYLYQQYLAVVNGNWKTWGPLSLAFLWLAVTLVLGRAWCSWACFYGGWDEFFSSILRKPLFGSERFAFKIRDLPAAILIFFLLASFARLTSSFCLWLCPFKLTTSFMSPEPFIRSVQAFLMFFSLGIVVFLSLLGGKRYFCSFLCPFAAWQSFFGKINPFRVKINPEKCAACMACVRACPVFAVKKGEDGRPKILDYCNLCGVCARACPSGAVEYAVFGLASALKKRTPWTDFFEAKFAFAYCCLVFTGVFSSLFGPAAIFDILNWTLLMKARF